jgi:hypothetical protein
MMVPWLADLIDRDDFYLDIHNICVLQFVLISVSSYENISDTRSSDDTALGIPAWFSEHYGSYRESLLTSFRIGRCSICDFVPIDKRRRVLRSAMTRHLCSHLEKSYLPVFTVLMTA